MSERAQVYSMEDRERAVMAYIAGGSFARAETITGIKQDTIRAWRDRDEAWWAETEEKLRLERGQEHRARLEQIRDFGLKELEDRIINGDVVLNKDGTQARRPMTGQALTIAVGTIIDKLHASPAQPASTPNLEKLLQDKREALRQAARDRALQEAKSSGKIVEMGAEASSDARQKKLADRGS